MKKILRAFFIPLSFLMVFTLSAQESSDDMQIEDFDSIIDLEEGSDEKADLAEQRPLTILMAQQPLNLDIHTSTYSSEAQILDSLYDGLFSYDPKTLDPDRKSVV